MPIPHAIDFVELAAYTDGQPAAACGCSRISTRSIVDRHVLIVEDVVDTGLTLNYLARTLALRQPASISAVDAPRPALPAARGRPPARYVGFTVPDELFAGYGLGLDERWRALPDLHVVQTEEWPASFAGTAAA